MHPDGTIFGRCVARIAAGGACDSYCEACGSPAQCAEDLVCREKKCQTPLTEGQTGCVPYRYVSLCAQGLFCLVDTCRKPGKVGDDCVSARDIVACEDGLFCPTTTKKCETIVYGNPGDPCDNGPRRCKTGKCSVDDYPYGASQVTPGVCP